MKLVFTLTLLSIAMPATAVVYHVGPGMPFERPSEAAAEARDGDTIEIESGEYVGDVAVWTQNDLTIRGINGKARLRANGNSAESKAIWVIKGDNTVVENIEFSGAVVEDQNGAGIRLEGANLTVRRCAFRNNENGILTGANPASEILVEHSEFGHNGYGDGYSHNIYVGRIAKLTIRFSYFHHARVGHQIKSRAVENRILFNRLMDERLGDSSYLIDLPEPGTAYVVGNEMQQGPRAENWALVHSVQDLVLVNNTLANDRHSGLFVKLGGETERSLLQNNLFVGKGTFEVGDAGMISNVHVQDGGFVDRRNYDYRLTRRSPAIDKGSPLESVHLHEGAVDAEYLHIAGRSKRRSVGAIDVGAHEFSAP
ncbi:MAG: right-handed parallel beta-helix repeat-containing protein [Woeseiaceae bacterium]|nr:right-handed parallel beta-helix repeat-containing protein [Woeseiaceae bacterium]